MKNDFVVAITQLSAEKSLDTDTVFDAVESAMASAFKNDDLLYADVVVKIDRDSGEIDAWRRYEVVTEEEIEDDELQISPERAAAMGHPGLEPGGEVLEPIPQSPSTGRIAAQTAKQVVLQRLREAEREAVYSEFTGKEGELVSGTVLRVEQGRHVIIDLGRTEAVLPMSEQVRPEHYRVGQRLRVYVKEVYRASKGPQVVISRSHPELVRRLLELEVPEIARGTVEVMGIARDPGYRSKVAVISRQHGIDPIGATIGIRGSRIQNIVNELNGERIDLIRWDPNDAVFVTSALRPAEVVSVRLDAETKTAFVAVPDKQMTLAIGKEGQNARLAAKLTGRRIDIQAEGSLIGSGADLYPPPEPNMEAIPRADVAPEPSLPPLPAPVAAGADYQRPGLPGSSPPAAPAAAPADAEPALTPEQEVLAGFVEEEEAAAPVAEAPPTPPRAQPAAPTTGLRFAEEISGLAREEEPEDRRPQRRQRRTGGRGGRAAGAERTPAAAREGRRFEIDEEEIEEGLAELHGEYGDDYTDEEE
ncbi:MAG: transcription termination factor NusA [Chloroflexi bacterium]|nr:transcription termination factor NusA [Chloroflexota bacterium]